MPASFPNAKKTFSAVVNGVTKLVAALFNSPYDEIEAIQTFLGPTGGGAQSYYTSLTDMLINYIKGCEVEYKGDADLYVRAGEIMIVDSSGNRRLRRNTTDTTVTWSDIDTGAEANSTTYYVYAVADANATTFTVKISTNASAPSGATYYRKIGSFYNDSSGNIGSYSLTSLFVHKKNNGFFNYVGAQVFSGNLTTTWTDLNLSQWVGQNRALVFLKVKPTGGNSHCETRTNGDSEEVGWIGEATAFGAGSSGANVQQNKIGYLLVMTDSSGIIEHKDALGTVAATITLVGYIK